MLDHVSIEMSLAPEALVVIQRPIVELLANRKFPELAAALRARRDQALAQWTTLVRDSLPSADRLTFEQLRDDMPIILEMIAKSLESDQKNRTDELLKAVPKHGVVRFHQSFSLSEMLVEYDLLRAAVMDQVVTYLGRKIEADEVVALNGSLDLTARRAVLTFVEHQNTQLQAATETQSKYLSFLSHDLRGGLNGVFLTIEVLRRELASEPRFSSTINDLNSMRRMLMETISTMDRFLFAERFRKGKVELKPGKIQLRRLLEQIASTFNHQMRDSGTAIRIDASEDCQVVSDREVLTVILQNLISNAVKYAPQGEINLTAAAQADGSCLVSIKDQGPGIEPEMLNRIFSEFVRGQTHGQPGAGLGLSIAQQAAAIIGGRLWAESTPGQGSTFHLQIPPAFPARPSEG
jgi:signal transduction histidine kinase